MEWSGVEWSGCFRFSLGVGRGFFFQGSGLVGMNRCLYYYGYSIHSTLHTTLRNECSSLRGTVQMYIVLVGYAMVQYCTCQGKGG